jgi:tetratricopeptide (TPR) repeat protein
VFRLDLADALSDAGLFAEAEAAYRKALAVAPDSAEAKARLGGFLVGNAPDAARLTEARRLLTDAVTTDQANDYALFRLGQCELQQGSVKEGAAHLEHLVARSPGIADAWYALARARRNRGDTTGADAALAVSTRLHREYAAYVKVAERVSAAPRDAAARLKLARSCVMRREMARALFHYGVCQKLDPTNAAVTAERDALAARLAAAGQMPDMALYHAMVAQASQESVSSSEDVGP